MMEIPQKQRSDLIDVLKTYLGTYAPLVLTRSEQKAASYEALCDLLVPALRRAEHRESFEKQFREIFDGLMPVAAPATGQQPAPSENITAPIEQLPDAPAATLSLSGVTVTLAERRLQRFIGESAIGASASLKPPPLSVVDLYEKLADLIIEPSLRDEFLKLSPRRN